MIQHSGSFEATWILRFLLLILATLISACNNDEIIEQPVQSELSETSLPVREWYPAPKHRQQPTAYAPAPTVQPQVVMTPPAYQGNIVQQPWVVPAPIPVYSAPQFVYQPQTPATQYQQPQVWTGQQSVTPMQQPVVPQYQPQYQYVPRPWGSLTEPNSNQGSAASTQAWPQGGYNTPWGMPVTGSTYNGPTAPPTGQVPGTVYYGNVW
jgi:hypothetical protein